MLLASLGLQGNKYPLIWKGHKGHWWHKGEYWGLCKRDLEKEVQVMTDSIFSVKMFAVEKQKKNAASGSLG